MDHRLSPKEEKAPVSNDTNTVSTIRTFSCKNGTKKKSIKKSNINQDSQKNWRMFLTEKGHSPGVQHKRKKPRLLALLADNGAAALANRNPINNSYQSAPSRQTKGRWKERVVALASPAITAWS